jgi:tmRNA-binding protein
MSSSSPYSSKGRLTHPELKGQPPESLKSSQKWTSPSRKQRKTADLLREKTLLVRKELIEDRKASYPLIKTSVYRQQNASKVENIHPNGRDCFSNRHDSERRLENPEKRSGMKRL